jgi:hypothetical protein
MRNLNDPYVNPELGNLNIESTYGLDTDEPASAGPLEFVPKNMCDESPFYKEITDRKNNMSDEDIEQQRRFNAQAAEARRQRRIEDNLEKKIYKKIIKSLLKKL